MTPVVLVLGGLIVYWASITLMVILPVFMIHPHPSEIWRPMTPAETEGNRLYVTNGCSYCHSLFIRPIDWGIGAERIAQSEDYYGQQPAILGTERTGPDLSQEGGEHTNDWHMAHFLNPRYTRPVSVMPSWEFLGREDVKRLTAYVQFLGGKNADYRTKRQADWQAQSIAAWQKNPDFNIQWLHEHVPPPWRPMPNPYGATEADLSRGKKIYQEYCVNCHGVMGDGGGPAASYLRPTPLNFTLLRRHLVEGKYIGGILYYQKSVRRDTP
jgi:cbb3-type cytochrome c oxidase subunit II